MALLTPQAIGDGVDITFAAVAVGGDTCVYDERAFLEFKNTNASTRTITVAIPGTIHGNAIPDLAVVIGATTGNEKIKLTPDMVDPATGLISITYSADAGVTVALQRV
jgi:hypothetical protein